MGKEQDWRDRAAELYRIAQTELLEHWRGAQEGPAGFLKEEMEEALLDLKQAVIEERKEDATSYQKEVVSTLTELRRLWEQNHG